MSDFKYEALITETQKWVEIDEMKYNSLFLSSFSPFSGNWGIYCRARKVIKIATQLDKINQRLNLFPDYLKYKLTHAGSDRLTVGYDMSFNRWLEFHGEFALVF